MLLALMSTEGETFHPLPRSRAAALPVPSVAIPPLPFSPVKFSGLIERDLASESRYKSPMAGTRLGVSAPGANGAIIRSSRNSSVRRVAVFFIGQDSDWLSGENFRRDTLRSKGGVACQACSAIEEPSGYCCRFQVKSF